MCASYCAWNNLSSTGGTVKGVLYNELACDKKALSINPEYAAAWNNFAIDMKDGPAKLDGTSYTKGEAYAKVRSGVGVQRCPHVLPLAHSSVLPGPGGRSMLHYIVEQSW